MQPRTAIPIAANFRRWLIISGTLIVLLSGWVQFTRLAQLRGDELSQRLDTLAQLSASHVSDVVMNHASAVRLVAGNGPTADGDWQGPLRTLHRQFPQFITVLVADRDGQIIHGEPVFTPDGRAAPWAGRNVADRMYFRVPMETGEPFVTDAFRGRSFGDDVIVGISAPLLDEAGVPQGVVEGSIAADAFASFRSGLLAGTGEQLLIVDRSQRVVHASDGLASGALEPFPAPLPDPAATPMALVNAPAALVDGGAAHVATARTPFGWTVAVLSPARKLDAELRRDLSRLMVPGFLALAAVVVAAHVAAARLAGPIALLAQRMRDYSTDRAQPVDVGDAPRELHDLAQAFNNLTHRLGRAFADLEKALGEKERYACQLRETVERQDALIAERTQTLRTANEQLSALALTDPLTGCLNVRGLHDRAEAVLADAAANRRQVAVLTLDVDHFKKYNDRYGHPAGDTCLRRIAAAVGGALYSSTDVLARVGGEEFIVLLVVESATAAEVAERLREAVAALGIPHEDVDGGTVTISLGGAGGNPASVSVQQLIDAADAALYRAKRAGRNTVMWSAEPTALHSDTALERDQVPG
jgi:diguanylate cyclase (GGDEF)-like protein